MRQKFVFDGDDVELILTMKAGDLLRAPLPAILPMAVLNDGELVRYTYQPPAPEESSPLPPRKYIRLLVEEFEPEPGDVLQLVEDETGTHVKMVAPTPPPLQRVDQDAAAAGGNSARILGDGSRVFRLGTPRREG